MKNPYQESYEKSPDAAAKRLLEVYDVASRAAMQKQADPVRHAIALLRSTLDPRFSPEIALSLAALYKDIEAAVEHEDFHTAARILEELKGLWSARIKAERFMQ